MASGRITFIAGKDSRACRNATREGLPSGSGRPECSVPVSFWDESAIRAYENRDFPGSLRLLQSSAEGGETIERLLALLTDESAVAMVAEDGGSLVGIAAGAARAAPAGSASSSPSDDETQARLVDAVEAVLADRGVKRVVVVAQEGSTLARRGYTTAGLHVYERALSGASSHGAVAKLGGRMIDPGLWDELRGMDEPKEIIERRVILPLAEPRAGQPPRRRAAEGDHPLRPSGHGQDDVREGDRLAARLAVLRGLAVGDRRRGRGAAGEAARRDVRLSCSRCRRRSSSSTRSKTSPRSATTSGA